jgi:predicted Zn-dependent peptidase
MLVSPLLAENETTSTFQLIEEFAPHQIIIQPELNSPFVSTLVQLPLGLSTEPIDQRGISTLLGEYLKAIAKEHPAIFQCEFQVKNDAIQLLLTTRKESFKVGFNLITTLISDLPDKPTIFQLTKQKLLRQVHQGETDPWEVLLKIIPPTAFRNLVSRHPKLGYPITLRQLSYHDLKKLLETRNQHGVNLLITGNVSIEDVKEQCTKLGTTYSISQKEKRPHEPALETIREVSLRLNTSVLYGAMAWPVINPTPETTTALKIVAELLGGGINSHLAEIMIKELKLVSKISVDYLDFQEAGLLVLRYRLPINNSWKARETLLRIISDIQLGQFTEAKLSAAMRRLSAKSLFLQDDTNQKIFFLADWIFTKEKQNPLSIIPTITKEKLKEQAARHLNRTRHIFATILPYGKEIKKGH